MTNTELKQWLRDNSSGVYRPAREAANLIGQLERELNEATTQLHAWQESFGTSQLTHALARLEAAEKRAAAMPNASS